MIRQEILNKLRETMSEDNMKRWEAQCKNEIIEYFILRTERSREEVIEAIKRTKTFWTNLYAVVRHKACGHHYGFFECQCEGDVSHCPHSHAYLDIQWTEFKSNGKIKCFEVRARPCEKYLQAINEERRG